MRKRASEIVADLRQPTPENVGLLFALAAFLWALLFYLGGPLPGNAVPPPLPWEVLQ